MRHTIQICALRKTDARTDEVLCAPSACSVGGAVGGGGGSSRGARPLALKTTDAVPSRRRRAERGGGGTQLCKTRVGTCRGWHNMNNIHEGMEGFVLP